MGGEEDHDGGRRALTLLLADGDRMGKAIAGLSGFEGQRALGEAVDAFSVDARGIVSGHGGSLVYSGGDDVLALLPLHTAVTCADALRKRFVERVGPTAPDGIRPTLSVGLALVHHLDSLTEARATAKAAEKLAKDAGRDRLAIVMNKRSGPAIRWVQPWSEDPARQLLRWMRALRSGALPDGVAFELEALLEPFQAPAPGGRADLKPFDAVLRSLAERAISRKRAEGGMTALSDEERRELLKSLDQPAESVGEAIRALSGAVQIARLLLAAQDVAWGSR